MTRTSHPVTPTPVPPGVVLDAAIDAAVIPLVEAVRDYAQAGGPDDALPGIRLLYAERAIFDALNDLLTALHADMDDIHRGPDAMNYVERRYDLLLGQMLSHHMPDLIDHRAQVAALRGENQSNAVIGEVRTLRNWAALIGEQITEGLDA